MNNDSNKIRVVLDTCVFIEHYIGKKPDPNANKVVNCWYNHEFLLLITREIVIEYASKLKHHGVSSSNLQYFLNYLHNNSCHLGSGFDTTILNNIDPKDNKFIATAYIGNADYIVSSDSDILHLDTSGKAFALGIKMRSPTKFLMEFSKLISKFHDIPKSPKFR